MKILLVTREQGNMEDLTIMLLSAMLKKDGHKTNIVQLNKKAIKKAIKTYNPDVLALSVFTGEHIQMIRLAKEIKKEFNIITIFGGSHITFSPEIIKEEGVDFIIIGEGELAFAELINNLENGKSTKNIKNVWTKEGNKIIKNELRPLIDNLDILPFPDRELIYKEFKHLRNSKKKYFIVGRGCPYACTYCFNHIYNRLYKNKGKIIRHRSIWNIIAEIKEVKSKYPLEFIHFWDDNLIGYDKEWTKEFFYIYKKEINLPFSMMIRFTSLTEEKVIEMKRAGCYSVCVGIECGDEEIRNNLLKRYMSNEQIINGCRLLKKHGIKILADNIVGLPVENPLETDIKTMKLNVKCKVDYGWSSLLYPYPKTEIYDYCTQRNCIDAHKNVIGNKFESFIKFKSKEEYNEIVNFHKLFGIAVEFPLLLPLIKIFIKLPFHRFYSFLFFAWYGYCFEIRLTPFSIFSMERNLQLIKSFIRYFKQAKGQDC